MKIKALLVVLITGCFMLFGIQSEAQKSNILIEKGLAYLASSQSSTKGYTPGEGASIDPDNLYQMTKTPGDWGGPGITGYCLQAFLQNGHNIDDPVYGTEVENAIDYILGRQNTTVGNYHFGAIGNDYGYETPICISSLKLALKTPLAGGGFISGQLKTDIETAIDDALNYLLQDVNDDWDAVSWRYNRSYTSEYGGDMSVNQWVFLALDIMEYDGKDIWNKIYTYLLNKKCSSGDYSYIGYQSCGTWAQGNTCAGVWGSVLCADHGVAGGSVLKNEFYNYLDNFTLSQLIDEGQINNNDVYVGGGYYYYLYEFSKAMALGNKTIFAGGDWYVYLYNAIESQHQTDVNENYYWNGAYGGQGNNMETALALLCLQTQAVPQNSTLTVSLNTNPTGTKSDCFEFSVSDELGNQAGYNGTNWFTNIPNSEWTSTEDDFYEITIEVEESTNYGAQFLNTCLTPEPVELCYKTFLEGELTDEECFLIEETPPNTLIGAAGFVNAIGGLNVIIVVPPTPIPEMDIDPLVVSINPFEYSQTFDFTFDIMETGGETPLTEIDLFASDLVDQFGNVIDAANVVIDPIFIQLIEAGQTQTVNVSVTTPANLTFDPGLFEGLITMQTADQAKSLSIELGSPDMMIDPAQADVSYISGATGFDIYFTGMVGADWEIAFDADWITVDPMMGSGDGMVMVNYEANNSDMERSAVVTITAPDALNSEETFTITQEGAPFVFFNYVDLEGSTNMMDWWDAPGSLAEGFMVGLNANDDQYYLNLGDATETNLPLAEEMFPFYLDPMSVPDGFYEYWEGRGVVEGAGSWQGVMWDIINGNEPTFYIKVTGAQEQEFMLVDGLQYLFASAEEYLMVPSDYPLGSYDYLGFIESAGGIPSEQIDVMITFYRPELLSAELLVSQDMNTWEVAFGNLLDGYLVRLDEMVANYYLNMGEATTNVPMINDMYPFYLDPMSVPDGFYEYWEGRGVVEGAGSWQGVMWDIINGVEPTFYIKVQGEMEQQFTLVDGLQYLFNGVEEYLAVPGDYPLGSYVYTGYLMGEYEIPSDMISVMITFASDIDQQLELEVGWLCISSYIIPEEPALETVFAGIEDNVGILVSSGGIYWPSQNINLIGDWNSYEGYKIKILEPTLLEFFGFAAEPSVVLPAGTSYMPVLTPETLNTDIFTIMGDDLIYAFNIQKQTVFWPEGNINTIGNIEPGVGYIVNLVNPVTVDFSNKTTAEAQSTVPFVNNSPWQDVVNTGSPHIISIQNSALDSFEAGDYIGLFDADGNIYGISEFNGGKENIALIANGDDITTPEIDGMAQGELMSLMVYKASDGQVYHLDVSYDASLNEGVFEAGGLSIITDLKVGALGINNITEGYFSAYPNPTTGQLNINASGNFDLRIINASGQLVYEATTRGNASIDLSALEKGVYFIKASNDGQMIIEKLIIE